MPENDDAGSEGPGNPSAALASIVQTLRSETTRDTKSFAALMSTPKRAATGPVVKTNDDKQPTVEEVEEQGQSKVEK